jgi:hypothetical protein
MACARWLRWRRTQSARLSTPPRCFAWCRERLQGLAQCVVAHDIARSRDARRAACNWAVTLAPGILAQLLIIAPRDVSAGISTGRVYQRLERKTAASVDTTIVAGIYCALHRRCCIRPLSRVVPLLIAVIIDNVKLMDNLAPSVKIVRCWSTWPSKCRPPPQSTRTRDPIVGRTIILASI